MSDQPPAEEPSHEPEHRTTPHASLGDLLKTIGRRTAHNLRHPFGHPTHDDGEDDQ